MNITAYSNDKKWNSSRTWKEVHLIRGLIQGLFDNSEIIQGENTFLNILTFTRVKF
jgi:hypothetical protein